MPKLQPLVLAMAACLGVLPAPAASAEEGFYGGLSVRDNVSERPGLSVGSGAAGLSIGKLPLVWNRFAPPTSDDSSQRTLVFGGYRWKNDVAVEAAVNTSDTYALGSTSLIPAVAGLALADATPSRSWNADLYTSWEFVRSLSLYGRLGYSQTEIRPLFAGASVIPGDPRRRDGVNYGLGFRYDMSRSLGMRVEYARFGRFTGDIIGNGLPESDQVSIGLQFRF